MLIFYDKYKKSLLTTIKKMSLPLTHALQLNLKE